MNVVYRKAVPEDAAACVDLRGKTRENSLSVEQLKAIGVTLETWTCGIAEETLPGYVCLSGSKIVGYCFGAEDTGEIAVLALPPAHALRSQCVGCGAASSCGPTLHSTGTAQKTAQAG